MTRNRFATAAVGIFTSASMFAAGANPAEASSSARPHKAAVHQTHRTPRAKNPHAGMRCAKYNMTGTKRTSCASYVKR